MNLLKTGLPSEFEWTKSVKKGQGAWILVVISKGHLIIYFFRKVLTVCLYTFSVTSNVFYKMKWNIRYWWLFCRSTGYGTRYGTHFSAGLGAYGQEKGFQKKPLGLGVGKGFLRGHLMGRAFLEVYHRYMLYMHLISIRQNTNYDQQYYSQYIRGGCFQACPPVD